MAKFIALLLVCFAAFGQTLSVINTGTTSNDGTGDSLRSAFTKANTNFYQLWSEVFTNIPVDIANAGGAGKLDTTNGTAVNLTGSLTNVTLDGATLAQPFAYNAGRSSGTNAYFNAGRITFRDGQVLSFAGGSVACIASRTNFIGINLFTGTLHALRRGVDYGTVFIARVVTDGGGITSVSQGPIALPPGRVERFKAAIKYPQHGLKLFSDGNSIMSASFGDTTNQWMDAIFSASSVPTTYQLSTNLSGLTWTDRSYGGQLSIGGLTFVGRSTTAGVTTNSNRSASWIYGGDYIARNGSSAFFQYDPAVERADLVILHNYFNGGRENLLWLETIVRKYRALGSEVILCIDNKPRDTDPDASDFYNAAVALAETYGCALADHQSYMEEQQSKGVTVHADANHPNQAGNDAIAECLRGVLNTYPLTQDNTPISAAVGRSVPLIDHGYTNGIVPREANYQFVPVETTGAYVATGITAGSDYLRAFPNINMAGRTTNDCVLELESGEYAIYAHPFAMGGWVLYESKSTSSSLAVHPITGGAASKTFSITSDDPALKMGEAVLAQEILISNSAANNDPTGAETTASPMRNFAIKLQSTSGTTRILGFVWLTVPWQEIPRSAMTFNGVWSTDTYASLVSCAVTDTQGSAVSFEFTGTGCILSLALHPSAGRIDVWLDGVQTHSDYNLLETAGRFTRSLLLQGTSPHSGFGRHTVRIVQDGATGSAAAVASTARRLMLLGAYALDTR